MMAGRCHPSILPSFHLICPFLFSPLSSFRNALALLGVIDGAASAAAMPSPSFVDAMK